VVLEDINVSLTSSATTTCSADGSVVFNNHEDDPNNGLSFAVPEAFEGGVVSIIEAAQVDPQPASGNLSGKVVQFSKNANAETWAGFKFPIESVTELGHTLRSGVAVEKISVNFYCPNVGCGIVVLKLESFNYNPEAWSPGSVYEQRMDLSETGKAGWQCVEFDLLGSPVNRDWTGGHIVLFMNFGSVSGESYYIDDLEVVPLLDLGTLVTAEDPTADDPGQDLNWCLVWSDEFDQDGWSVGPTTVDSEKWTPTVGTTDLGFGNGEQQVYTDRLKNLRVENGLLYITPRKEAAPGIFAEGPTGTPPGNTDPCQGKLPCVAQGGSGICPGY